MTLQGKNIFISGASGEIGAQVALKCSRAGATCVLLGRQEKKLARCYDAIVESGGPTPILLAFDLQQTDLNQYQTIAKHVEETFTQLDSLIHLSGHPPKLTPIEHYDCKHWYQTLQVNLHAPFLLTQALLPILKKAPTACVLFNRMDLNQKAFWGAHGCAAAAVDYFRHLLEEELMNTTIRVSSIAIEAHNSQFRRALFPAEPQENLKDINQVSDQYLDALLQHLST